MNSSITNLTKAELVDVYGGKMTSKTSFAYDVTCCLLTVLYWCCEGVSMIKG